MSGAGARDPAPQGRGPHGRYVATLLAAFALPLALVVSLNLLLGQRSMGSPAITRAASEWQQATRGITYAPPITANRPFKALRLHDRAPEIEVVVFGASSSMGFAQSALPSGMHLYNFAQTGNPPHATVGEAAYVLERYSGTVRRAFLALDWAPGAIYMAGDVRAVDLSPEKVLAGGGESGVPLLARLRDAVSWPRVRNLGELLVGILRSPNAAAAFRELFLGGPGADYRCPDGAPGRDFDTINRGLCAGFRYDGSATFADGKRVDPARAAQLVAAGAAPSSRYSQALATTGGEPNRAVLERLAALAARYRDRGSELAVFMPPLFPGLERALASSPHSAEAVRTTKAALDEWARRNGLAVLDAGASERFGCVAAEFLDEHHAFPECFDKVMRRYFARRESGALPPGLWTP